MVDFDDLEFSRKSLSSPHKPLETSRKLCHASRASDRFFTFTENIRKHKKTEQQTRGSRAYTTCVILATISASDSGAARRMDV